MADPKPVTDPLEDLVKAWEKVGEDSTNLAPIGELIGSGIDQEYKSAVARALKERDLTLRQNGLTQASQLLRERVAFKAGSILLAGAKLPEDRKYNLQVDAGTAYLNDRYNVRTR